MAITKRLLTFASVALLLVLAGCMFHRFEHSQVYHPTRQFVASGNELGRSVEDIFFSSSDGVRLHGWFFPATAMSPRASLAVLICHGNGGNISHRLDLYEALLDAGVNVFSFDYRGYGQSEGRAGEEGTYRDAQAAHQWLRQKGFSGDNIIAYGESLGGAVAAELAVREPVGGLILQSTFTSIPDIGEEIFPWLPVRWLAKIQYDTCRKLPKLKIPILLMHSRTDEIIGFAHCEKNFAAANEPKLLWEISGSHNEALNDSKPFVDGIEKFFRLLESGEPKERAAGL